MKKLLIIIGVLVLMIAVGGTGIKYDYERTESGQSRNFVADWDNPIPAWFGREAKADSKRISFGRIKRNPHKYELNIDQGDWLDYGRDGNPAVIIVTSITYATVGDIGGTQMYQSSTYCLDPLDTVCIKSARKEDMEKAIQERDKILKEFFEKRKKNIKER